MYNKQFEKIKSDEFHPMKYAVYAELKYVSWRTFLKSKKVKFNMCPDTHLRLLLQNWML